MSNLTERVIRYQETGAGLEELTSDILVHVYRYPRMRRGFDEDDCGEFCLQFYPRIERLIERFTFSGIPFEAYLATNVKWQLRTYIERKRSERRLASVRNYELLMDERTSRRSNVDGVSVDPEEDAELRKSLEAFYGIEQGGVIAGESLRRRLLILTMKGCATIRDEQILAVAHAAGFDPDWMLSCAHRLRATMVRREQRVKELRARRNRAYLSLRLCEDKLVDAVDEEEKTRLRLEISRYRRTLNLARLCLSRVPRYPTHTELSDVLGIPKGSIDSSMYYVRRSCRKAEARAGSPNRREPVG